MLTQILQSEISFLCRRIPDTSFKWSSLKKAESPSWFLCEAIHNDFPPAPLAMVHPRDHTTLALINRLDGVSSCCAMVRYIQGSKMRPFSEFLMNLGYASFRKSPSTFYAPGTGPDAGNLFFWKQRENKQ